MTVDRSEERSALSGLHKLAPISWWILVAGVVLFALYVASGRYLMSQVPRHQDMLIAQLGSRLPFALSVQSLAGGWTAFSPELRFRGLRLTQAGLESAPVIVGSGSLRVDVLASVLTRSVQLSRLEVEGLALDARITAEGVIEIEGLSGGDSGALLLWLEDFLPNVERVALSNNQVKLATAGGSTRLVLDLLLQREGNARRLEGRALGENMTLAVNAEGVGNPLRPLSWAGDIFIDATSSDLAAESAVWESFDLPFSLRGDVDLQFWLTRAAGDSTARMRWSSNNLQLDERSGAWSLPLDALSFEAALDQRDRHWSLLTEDFHIERAGKAVDLNRAQFDWWGQALRIRATDLALDALPGLLAAAPGIPDGLRDALPALAPTGLLRSIELRLDDLSRPADSWQLRSAVSRLGVSSWRATPALEGVSGFLELAPGRGSLQLDSQQFSMHFPTVYREPLGYEDALGEIRLAWDSQSLQLSSGLMQLTGREGVARGLFSLDIPFSPRVTGVELEILAGIEDSQVERRAKYLPYKLPGPLLDWLDRGLVDGIIERAGFIYRGSTLPKNFPHMSLQLFVDGRDATVQYDPAWPLLRAPAVSVWVDDGRTWARAAEARNAGAEITDLMVRVLPEPGGAQLDIAARLQSDVRHAQTLLRDTPLADVTQEVFADWVFSGALAGDVAISLPIRGEASAPLIDLQLELREVSAQIAQLGLRASGVNGELRYQTSSGFRGSFARAELLGGDLSITAEPGEADILNLRLEGDAGAANIAEWLQLPLLGFARGGAPFEATLDVDTEAGGQFELLSELSGISLDLPRPFTKSAEQPLELRLAMALREDPQLKLELGERVSMQLDLVDAELAQLAVQLGGGGPEAVDCRQRYCVAGNLSSLDIAEWGDFAAQYLDPGPDAGSENPDGAAVTGERMSYQIDSLRIGQLSIAERSLGAARVDLWGRDALWQGALETEAVQGSLTRENGELQLLLEYLDLGVFQAGEPVSLAQARSALPSMRVDILELRSGDRVLGNVGFDIDAQRSDTALYFAKVDGELWGLRLSEPQPGMLRWSERAGVETTALELDVAFAGLGDVQEAAGLFRSLESERGRAALRLQWPGPPSGFDIASTRGSMRLEARDGRLLETRPGALSMVSLLNFAEILRGLSLSHMFESGIPFITASTDLEFRRGRLDIRSLEIDGPASAFEFSGESNLNTRSIDGELLVTLPVANNLPWVAALAAGPAVAAGVFVVSKVFEKQVNRMSSAIYTISGSIDSPELEFRRLFDDQLAPRQQSAARAEQDAAPESGPAPDLESGEGEEPPGSEPEPSGESDGSSGAPGEVATEAPAAPEGSETGAG